MPLRLSRLLSEERSTALLGLVRVAFAALLLRNSVGLWRDLEAGGYFGDFFHLPVFDPAWVPNELGYRVLLGIKIVACACAMIGLASRPALLLAASIGLYLLACDRLQYHNNRYTTHLLCFLLAFAPCDRSFRLRLPRRPSARPAQAWGAPGPLWAARLVQLQMCAIYLTSGGGKLLNDDWRGGRVMLLRFSRGASKLLERGVKLPEPIVELLNAPAFASLASKLAISTELFLALGLFHPATRVGALWLGVMFHLGIEATAHVDLFSWVMLSGYVLFATPELRERTLHTDPSTKRGRALAALLPYFDWLMRLRLVKQPLGGGSFAITDRVGTLHRGRYATTALCRTIPLLFPLWLPLAIADRVASRRNPARVIARNSSDPT